MNVYLDVPGIATRSQPTAMIIISTSNPISHSSHASVSVESQDVGIQAAGIVIGVYVS